MECGTRLSQRPLPLSLSQSLLGSFLASIIETCPPSLLEKKCHSEGSLEVLPYGFSLPPPRDDPPLQYPTNFVRAHCLPSWLNDGLCLPAAFVALRPVWKGITQKSVISSLQLFLCRNASDLTSMWHPPPTISRCWFLHPTDSWRSYWGGYSGSNWPLHWEIHCDPIHTRHPPVLAPPLGRAHTKR